MIRAGLLNRRVTFEELRETVAPSGAVASSWAPVSTIPCAVEEEAVEDAQGGPAAAAPRATVTLRIRHREGITTALRMVLDGRRYAITAAIPNGRRTALELRGVAL